MRCRWVSGRIDLDLLCVSHAYGRDRVVCNGRTHHRAHAGGLSLNYSHSHLLSAVGGRTSLAPAPRPHSCMAGVGAQHLEVGDSLTGCRVGESHSG